MPGHSPWGWWTIRRKGACIDIRQSSAPRGALPYHHSHAGELCSSQLSTAGKSHQSSAGSTGAASGENLRIAILLEEQSWDNSGSSAVAQFSPAAAKDKYELSLADQRRVICGRR
jgi:hypothetical protein